ncbi:MAG: CpaF/VirB11 family protein, partial [Clostridia bacterium]|nr:CpaF/VirB11 family protein [Clostridia bacterium]
KTTVNTKPHYSPKNPIVVSNKDNSNRITVGGYISTPTERHLYYNERIFNLPDISLGAMKTELETIDDLIYDLIEINQEGKGKYLITGADMGVGKSTLLVAMLGKVPNRWSIGIIDSQDETQADVKYPHKDIRMLVVNPIVGIEESFEKMLKMKRDILNVGEITAPQHIAELINAGLRLNSGVGATLHSYSPYEVVTNCRNLMIRSDMYDSSEVAEADISRCIDLIFHLRRHPVNHKRIVIDRIVEIQYVDQNHFIEPSLRGDRKEKISTLLNMAQLALSKYLYRKNYRYNNIFAYHREKDDWIPMNLPSEDYFKKMVESNFVSQEKIEKWKESFLKKKREM